TRAQIARERGLGPLADRILAQPLQGDPLREAAKFVDPNNEVPDAEAALAGARDIMAEIIAEQPEVRAAVREAFAKHGIALSEAARGKKNERSKFEQYYDFAEPVRS